MKLHDLQYLPPVTLAASQTVYRVQRIQARPGAASIGSLKMAPIGDMYGRFALATIETCYFAESPETAIYESLVRREAVSLSISNAAGRQLLCLRTTRPVQLLDLRQHVSSWPVLQSLRFSVTQEIAADAVAAGFEGIAYRSAQHYGQDCFVVFGASLKAFKLQTRRSGHGLERQQSGVDFVYRSTRHRPAPALRRTRTSGKRTIAVVRRCVATTCQTRGRQR